MKISSINSTTKNSNNQQNFKGAVSTAVKFWHFVDTHGKAMQFTVEDMTGTNIPRSIKGALAGYKYTGKISIPGLLQEAIREFLTGPTMCVTPFVILNLAMKRYGKNIDTHIENLTNLSHLALRTAGENSQITKDDFYKTVAQDLLKLSTQQDNISQENVTNLANGLKNYETLYNTDKKGMTKEAKKELKKNTQSALENLQKLFEKIIKSSKDSYANTDFRTATYSINESKQSACNFKSYMNYATAYANSLFKDKDTISISQDSINSFRNTWIGRRAATVASMIVITGFLMSFIPKIYTFASGKVNPNAKAIYDEAKGLNNKDKGGK